MADTFQEVLSSDVLPNGRLYFNIAEKIIAPMLENNHNLVADNAVAIQETLNELAGIGIKGQRAELNSEKVQGILQRLADEPNFDDVKWILKNPVVNFTQNVMDETIRKNVAFHAEAGLTAKVSRIAEAKACKWCRSLVGSYVYPNIPEDVWKRHQNDKCLIIYTPEKGKGKSTVTGARAK